jgi:hypothetical protein
LVDESSSLLLFGQQTEDMTTATRPFGAINNPAKYFCCGDRFVRVSVCPCVRPSGKWLVGPSSTSNRSTSFFISLRDTGRCFGVSLCRADESGQRRARSRAPKSGRALRFVRVNSRVNVVVYQSFPSVGTFGALLALKLSHYQRLSQGSGAVRS